MKLIGLTGGIASGKSTIARRLAEHGAVHIDADQLAREAVALGSEGLRRVRDRFGEQIIGDDGTLDRARLGALVFADREALNDLNAIVHPEVRRLADERISEAVRVNSDAIIVYDVPLLVESGVQHPWDLIVVAEAPVETRVMRLVSLRGMTEEEARRRIANQASDATRREIADVVVDTSGSEQYTLEQADQIWLKISE